MSVTLSLLRWLATAILLSLALNLPTQTWALLAPWHAPLALELVLVVAALALVPRLRGRLVAHAVAVAVLGLIALRLADFAAHSALDRPFNLAVDGPLALAVVDLAVGAFGPWRGALALAGGLLLLGLLYALAYHWLRRAGRWATVPPGRRGLLAGAAVCLLLYGLQQGLPTLFDPYRPVALKSPALLTQQARLIATARAARADFAQAARHDPFATLPPAQLLRGLNGVDVLLVFVESYGSSALTDPRYAPTILPTLDRFQAALDTAGLQAVSGWLVSPTSGGQSWLAHGTLLSGLWLDSQLLYDLLLDSGRLTLPQYFARAGYRTLAGMPAMIRAWPEGEFFGYDKIYTAAEFAYAGPPYNWVTMPDQYTLSLLHRRERPPAPRAPLFAEIALISSHAPWTPVAELVENWDEIGDGQIFARWAGGESPASLWRDHERVRVQYAQALAYSLNVLASYARHYVGEDCLLIVVGDHQPAPLITGEHAPRTVPMHVIAADPALLAPFQHWGYAPGLRPGATVRRMDDFRDWFLQAFTPHAATTLVTH